MSGHDKFIFHRSYLDAVSGFDDIQDAKDFVWAVVWYGIEDKVLETKSPVAFEMAKSLIDRYRDKEEHRKSVLRENGKKGGRPKSEISEDNE